MNHNGANNGTEPDQQAPPPATPPANGPKAAAVQQAIQRAREDGPEYVEEEDRDFQGQAFTKCKPVLKVLGVDNPIFTDDDERWGPPLEARGINHIAIGCWDHEAICRFWTKVMGFKKMERPDLGFPGYWLQGAGVTLHIIQHDPTVPRRQRDWKEQFVGEPEAWMIRRNSHVAFDVLDIDAAERALRRHGVEFSKHVLPGEGTQQLFMYDPEGNGVELRTPSPAKGWLGGLW